MIARSHSIEIETGKCIGCVACSQVCPTRAIRVRAEKASVVHDELCIDCGACIEACRAEAVRAKTSSPADLAKFRHTVAIPSVTLYGQFGKDARPGEILRALRTIGFGSACDLSWMCEMVAGASDAYLSECGPPWPKISVTCPAVVRLVQIRYPDLVSHLVPIETPRELLAKFRRRRLAAELGLDPSEIGIFFITPCSAIVNSIASPVGLDESYYDGAFAISELYGPLREAMRRSPGFDSEENVSAKGLGWTIAGGETAGMRNANSMTVRGLADVTYVFDRIESGTFQSVDFIEAYVCPDGCVSGPLTIAGRYAAQRNILQMAHRLGKESKVKEEKVRALLREHFFDFETEVRARPVQPIAKDLRRAIAVKKERETLLGRLPGKRCGACGAPDCESLVEDVLRGEAKIEECVFLMLEASKARGAPDQGGEDGKEDAPPGAPVSILQGETY